MCGSLRDRLRPKAREPVRLHHHRSIASMPPGASHRTPGHSPRDQRRLSHGLSSFGVSTTQACRSRRATRSSTGTAPAAARLPSAAPRIRGRSSSRRRWPSRRRRRARPRTGNGSWPDSRRARPSPRPARPTSCGRGRASATTGGRWRCAGRPIVIETEHGGQVPSTVEALLTLPGVGPYTARAVAALAFGLPVGAVDVNVRRVLGRIAAGGSDGLGPAALQSLADAAVPRDRPGEWTHAVMDIGATLCKPRRPDCASCPARAWCAFAVAKWTTADRRHAGGPSGPPPASRRRRSPRRPDGFAGGSSIGCAPRRTGRGSSSAARSGPTSPRPLARPSPGWPRRPAGARAIRRAGNTRGAPARATATVLSRVAPSRRAGASATLGGP